MMKRLLLLLLFAIPVLAQDPLGASFKPSIDTTCTDYPSNIWVSDGLQEVYQTTGSAPVCVNNSFAYSNGSKWIIAYSTQNSFADFQVHFHDTGSGTTGYQVTVSSFVQTSPGSFTIAAPDSSHRDTVIYLENYITVPNPGSAVAKTGTPSYLNIIQTPGTIPDILIPAIDPYYHQTTNAFPVTISANNNQSIWIDVHIPTTAPAGWYKGTVTVQTGCTGPYPSTGCTTVTTLPILLAVWQWPHAAFMPSTATQMSYHVTGDGVCSTFYNAPYTSACGAWPNSGGSQTTASVIAITDIATMELDHRLNAPNQVAVSPLAGQFSTYYPPLLNGTANTILPGAKLNAVERSTDGGTIANWMSTFQTGGWLNTGPYGYIGTGGCDEPPNGCGTGTWNSAISAMYNNAVADHGNSPAMPQLVSTSFARFGPNETAGCSAVSQPPTCLENSIDIMVTNVSDMSNSEYAILSTYHTWAAGSTNIGNVPAFGTPTTHRQWWSYLACDSVACGSQLSTPGSFYLEAPAYSIDTTPISHRVQQWFEAYAGQTGELYFADSTCWGTNAGHNSGCSGGTTAGDPLTGDVKFAGEWGAGALIYPGRQTGTPTGFRNVGVTNPIMLPSVRMKMIRDGMQDFEIMNVLKANGQSTAVSSAITSFMNTSPGSTGTQAWSFNNTEAPVASVFTSDLPDALFTLGTIMHQLTFPPAPPSVYVAQTAGTFSGCTGGACACNGQTVITPASITWASGTTYVMCGTITFGTNVTGMAITTSGTSSSPIIIQFDTNAILQSPQFTGCTDGPGGGASAAGGAINTNGQSFIIIDGQNTGTIQNTANGNTLTNDTCTVLLYLNGDNIIVRNLTLQNAYQWPSGAAADNNGTNTGDIYANVTNYLKICNNTISNAALGAELNFNYAGGVTPGTIEACNGNTFTAGNFNIANNTWNDHAWVAHFNGAGVPLIYGNDLMPAPSWQNWKNTTAHTDGWFFVGNSATTFQPQVFWNMFRGDIQSSSPTAMLFTTDDGVASSGKGAALAIYGNIFYGQGSSVLCCQGIGYQATSGDPKGPFAIYNNTFVNTAFPNELYTQAAGTPTVDWRNNIYWLNATGQNAYFYQNQDGGWTFGASVTVNGNDYFGGRALPFGIFISPSTFATWKASCVSGSANLCDASSITNDPTLFSEGSFGSGTTIADGSGFYETVTSPTRNLGDNLTSKCTTLVGLCTSPPQHFGVGSTCGTGCASRPATGQWDTGAYQFVNITPATNAPAVLFVKEF